MPDGNWVVGYSHVRVGEPGAPLGQSDAADMLTMDLAPFEKLLAVLARPFDDQPDVPEYALPPRPEQVVRATFCGT